MRTFGAEVSDIAGDNRNVITFRNQRAAQRSSDAGGTTKYKRGHNPSLTESSDRNIRSLSQSRSTERRHGSSGYADSANCRGNLESFIAFGRPPTSRSR